MTDRDCDGWYSQTIYVGVGHGLTDKEPQKRPAGFSPPKPKVEVAKVYRPKKHPKR